jgi:hypothetical protein
LEEEADCSRAVGVKAKSIPVVHELCDVAGEDENEEGGGEPAYWELVAR